MGWAARFAVLEEVLLRKLHDDAPRPEVAEAWRLTTSSGGRLPVAAVAARIGWSTRHLEQQFRSWPCGRWRAGPLDLAGLAGVTGFADQTHLTREWRAMSGLPPTRWLAAEFGFVQETPGC